MAQYPDSGCSVGDWLFDIIGDSNNLKIIEHYFTH